MYYTACLLLTIQWQLLCQAIVSLVYKWEGLLKIVWGGGVATPATPPRSDPALLGNILPYYTGTGGYCTVHAGRHGNK